MEDGGVPSTFSKSLVYTHLLPSQEAAKKTRKTANEHTEALAKTLTDNVHKEGRCNRVAPVTGMTTQRMTYLLHTEGMTLMPGTSALPAGPLFHICSTHPS